MQVSTDIREARLGDIKCCLKVYLYLYFDILHILKHYVFVVVVVLFISF